MNRLLSFALVLLAAPALAQTPDYEALARRIVQTTAHVQPGEVVGIAGGQHTVPLLEAITIEVYKAGGRPITMLTTDRIERAVATEVPEEYLGRVPVDDELLDDLDVYISLPQTEDEVAVYGDVPPERFAVQAAAYEGFERDLDASGVRDVQVGFPSEAEARFVGLDPEEAARMHWAALAADYDAIGREAATLAERFERARQVHITTPAGTDVTVALGRRHVFRSDGVADLGAASYLDRTERLPGGQITVVPVETSAEGLVVVPHGWCFTERTANVRFRLSGGVMEALEADAGAGCIQERMAPYAGPKDRLGLIRIGLNPALVPTERADALDIPGDAAGVVYLSLGGNRLYGGENDTQGGFGFPLTRATVEVDGAVVVRDGRLVPGATTGSD